MESQSSENIEYDLARLRLQIEAQLQSLRSRGSFKYKNYTLYARNKARGSNQKFCDLYGIDPAVKDRISPTVRQAIFTSSKLYALTHLFVVSVTLLIAIIYVIIGLAILIIIVSTAANTLSAIEAIVLYFVLSITYSLVYYLLNTSVFKKLKGRSISYWNNTISVICGIVVCYVLFVAGLNTLNVFTLAIFLMAATSLLYLVLLTPLVYLTYGLWKIIVRQLAKSYFQELTIIGLLELTYLLQTSEQTWILFEFRRKRANELEIIAEYFENYLPRALRAKDFATDSWLEESGRKIAATFRLYKRSVLLPTETTQSELQEELLTSFLCAAQGDWGSLLQSEPISLDRTQVFQFLKRLVRAIITGAIPMVIVRVSASLGFTLSGSASDIVTGSSLLWLILAILEVVDPNLSSRLASLKNLRDSLHL